MTGVVAEILVQVDETVEVGTVLARIAVGGDGAVPAPPLEPRGRATRAPPCPRRHGRSPATPPLPAAAAAATPTAEQLRHPRRAAATAAGATRRSSSGSPPSTGSTSSTVPGTGRGGRVRKQDVLAVVGSSGRDEPPLHIESPYRPEPHAPRDRPRRRVPAPGQLSRMRRQIGEHMKRSLDTAATCTTWIEVDMTRVEAARARLGVTALPFVARASIDALREHPALNAWLEGERYTRHERRATSGSRCRSATTA